MLKVVDFIRSNDNWRELLVEEPYCLTIKEDDDYVLLKYNMLFSQFSNPIVQECRGLILRKPDFEPVCVPFYKFFNYGEPNAHELDWDSVRFEEKLDGSLIKTWYDNEHWHVSTNGTIDAEKAEIEDLKDNEYKNFKDLFLVAWDMEYMEGVELDQNCTYMFELTSPYNRIVTPHDRVQIRHIGTRNNRTLEEIDVDITIEKPKQYSFRNLQECLDIAKDLPYNEEGYIAVDKNYNRVKIKSPAYVAMHHVISQISSKRNIMEVVLKGEKDEVLTYFPEFSDVFNEIDNKLQGYLKRASEDVETLETKCLRDLDRKNYAEWAKEKTNPSVMFKLYDNKEFDWEKRIKETPVKRLLQMIGVKE